MNKKSWAIARRQPAKRMSLIKNQQGVVLLLTLLMLSSILVITLGAADLVVVGIKMNRQTGYSSLAFFASEAGMERALWEARKDEAYSLPAINVDNIFGQVFLGNNSSYLVNYATSTPNVTFKSIGSFAGVKRSVESTYEVD